MIVAYARTGQTMEEDEIGLSSLGGGNPLDFADLFKLGCAKARVDIVLDALGYESEDLMFNKSDEMFTAQVTVSITDGEPFYLAEIGALAKENSSDFFELLRCLDLIEMNLICELMGARD